MASFIIEDWMISEKKLGGHELLAFALIHSVTQGGNGCWYGGYDKLAERIGAKQRGTIDAIKSLVSKGLIEKGDAVICGRVRNVLKSTVKTSAKTNSPSAKNAEQPQVNADDNSSPALQKMQRSSAKNAENNRDNYTTPSSVEDTKVSPTSLPPRGSVRSRFVPPTVDEVRDYCEQRKNNIDPEAFVDFYETNGWVQGKQGKPIKDWKACVRTWERNHVQAGRINKTTPSGSTMDQYTQALLEIDKQYGFSQGTSGIDEQ